MKLRKLTLNLDQLMQAGQFHGGAELRESWQRGPNENTNCLFRRYFPQEPTS